mgnify:CR=1 FL=1
MYFDTCEVAPLMTNCYLVGDETEKVCAVVDPGGSPDLVLDMIERSGLTPAAIFLTHGHYDHVRGIPGLLQKYPDLPVYCHDKDICAAEHQTEPFFLPHTGANQRTYGEGDTVKIGTLAFQILHTPGHSGGSVVLLVEDLMLCGDTLFAGSMGRCDLPGGNEDTIWRSLARLASLEGNFKVLPGHGLPSTLERERNTNPYMRQAMRL